MEKHFGTCLCTKVEFEVSGSFDSFYLCHCKFCQKDTGSAHAANLFSQSAQLSWIKGEDQIKTYTLSGTRHAKAFCQECGSAVPNVQMNGKLLVVPAGSLDSQLLLKPNAHLFVSSRAGWDHELETIKSYETFPV